jgi:hypothetical protein
MAPLLALLVAVLCVPYGHAAARGGFADLHVGRGVEIEGTLVGARRMQATAIEIRQATDEDQEVTGTIEAIDAGAKTVTVLGVKIVAADTTIVEDEEGLPVDFSSLKRGWRIKAEGTLQAGALAAEEIKMKEAKEKAKIQGKIEGVDPAAQTLTVMGLRIDVTPATSIHIEEPRP